MDTNRKGLLSEKYAEYLFVKNGYDVFLPCSASSIYDLLVTTKKGDYHRLQVKTLVKVERVVKGRIYEYYLFKKKGNKVVYKKGDFDFYVLVSHDDNLFYVIPYSAIKSCTFKIGGVYDKYLFNFDLDGE